MNKFTTIAVSLLILTADTFARMGSSYHRSSSFSSRSSSSYSRPSSSYSRPSTSSYSRPSYTTPSRPSTSYSRPAPTVQHVTVNKTKNVTNNNHDSGGSGNNGGGGMGIGGTILGVAGGVVAGNLLTSALMGDHRNSGYAPSGGYRESAPGVPAQGQPVSPAMVGQSEGSYVTDGKGGYMAAPVTQAPAVVNMVPAEEDHRFLRFLAYTAIALILLSIIYWTVRKYMTYRERKNEVAQMLEEERNLSKFESMFKTIQTAYSSNSKISLITMMVPDIYKDIMLTKSANEDQALTNVVEDIEVHSLTNISSWVEDNKKYQQVKIRFSMIDYTIDDKGELTHGSKDKRETAVEYWTFVSSSKNDWVLSSIKQHSGYVHQS